MTMLWICKNFEYLSGFEYGRFLNVPRFWICSWFEYMPEFWICPGDNVLIMPEYVWTVLIYTWICLNMPEYAEKCVNVTKSAWMTFVLHFPIVIFCSYKTVVNYFNVYMKLEVIVWRNMRLVSWSGKIWFFLVVAWSICFIRWFRLNIFTSKISSFLRGRGALGLWILT